MKLKLIKDLLSDICKILRPLIFDLALAIPIVAANEYGLPEEVMGPIALVHVIKALAIGVLIDMVWVFIWTRIASKKKKLIS